MMDWNGNGGWEWFWMLPIMLVVIVLIGAAVYAAARIANHDSRRH